jgi:hypothetical protein
MDLLSGRRLPRTALFAVLTVLISASAHAQWTTPTPEELSMTSQPEVPGAAAVYLYREEITDDEYHNFSVYVRLKVLAERGKEFSNVELNYAHDSDGGGYNVSDIQGRTIHPDGTIIPFTGKPYDKLVEKTGGIRFMSKVFTMPDVEVGSIIEYRYHLRYDDDYYIAPRWYIQSSLYTRKAHYLWKPTDRMLTTSDDRGQLTNTISWSPILPPNTTVSQTRLPPVGVKDGQLVLELNVQNIPPAPEEDYMPPMASLTYRVLFYYSPYHNEDEYWKSEIKHWAKLQNKIIGPGTVVRAAVHDIVAPGDTEDQQLRKIYAAVMKLENTSYTRQRSSAEEKAEGLKEVRNTDDIWTRKRGNNEQLTELFVAMARVTGAKAYIGAVTNRDKNVFLKNFLSLSQLDDYIAIVNVDGKDMPFDPGSRFCPYQHLAWKHTYAGGIRQTDAGGDLFATSSDPYSYSRTQRVANLTMKEDGTVAGTVKMTYLGSPGLNWRQRSLEGDSASLERELRTSVENQLPQGLEVKLASIVNLDDYEQPLSATFDVKGNIGSATGKRLFIPGDIFQANTKPAFPHEKREIAVYFHYPYYDQDAVRINFPSTLHVESLPVEDKATIPEEASYAMKVESSPTSFTIRRDLAMAKVIFMPDQYQQLRSFYSKMENKDQENIILTNAPVAAKSAGN